MPFISPAPTQPPFLVDITDQEIKGDNFLQRRLVFNSKVQRSAEQHTINDIQFENGEAFIKIVMGAVEEWTIQNTTNNVTGGPTGGGGVIDHPLHIHINPFQITEFFDPHENMTNPDTGQLLGTVVNGKTVPIPQYRIKGRPPSVIDPRQCELDPDQPSTWVPCPNAAPPPKGVWWDVFAIPSGVGVKGTGGKPDVIIPGYYKMRSRFVDYKGLYVLHCHILIHEDRGMMFSVQVIKPDSVFVRHH
jgi:FtsP/CotA-like multicopper oxidase with cupredoxin domain